MNTSLQLLCQDCPQSSRGLSQAMPQGWAGQSQGLDLRIFKSRQDMGYK